VQGWQHRCSTRAPFCQFYRKPVKPVGFELKIWFSKLCKLKLVSQPVENLVFKTMQAKTG
jgi:hypothetical protein